MSQAAPGEVVQRRGREDKPAEARFHVLPRVRHLDCLTVRTRAPYTVTATSLMSPLIAGTWRSRMSPAGGDPIRRAALELVLHHRRAVKGLRGLAQLLTDLSTRTGSAARRPSSKGPSTRPTHERSSPAVRPMRSAPSRATAHDAVGRATPDGDPRAGTPGYDWTTRTPSALSPGRSCTTRGVQDHTTPSTLSGGLRTARGESDVVPKSQRRLATGIFEFRSCP